MQYDAVRGVRDKYEVCTAIHDTRYLYVYNVFVQYIYTLIREPHPADPPFRHISMLTYHHKVTCILGLGSLCLYYVLKIKGNMYQCGGYFMPLFCILLYSYI